MIIHVLFGIATALAVFLLFPTALDWRQLVLVGVIGSLLPDIDHVFFIFGYGAHTSYARKVREYLSQGKWPDFVEFCKKNHKGNTGIYSHTLYTCLASILVGIIFWHNQQGVWAAFWFSITSHFVFDMAEDILFLGRLNPNWLGRYQPTAQKLILAEN